MNYRIKPLEWVSEIGGTHSYAEVMDGDYSVDHIDGWWQSIRSFYGDHECSETIISKHESEEAAMFAAERAWERELRDWLIT